MPRPVRVGISTITPLPETNSQCKPTKKTQKLKTPVSSDAGCHVGEGDIKKICGFGLTRFLLVGVSCPWLRFSLLVGVAFVSEKGRKHETERQRKRFDELSEPSSSTTVGL